MYKLNFSESFHADVKLTIKYIKDTLKAPVAADRLKDEIKKAYKSIRETPYIYPSIKDEYLASIGYRFIPVKNYMMFYIVNDEVNEIDIVRFLYGPRDWITILSDMK